MSFFITDKETEALLESETRILPMPDGTQYSYTGFKLMWNTMDNLIEVFDYKVEEFVKFALMDVEETGKDFDTAFSNMVGFIRQSIEDKLRS